MLLTLINYILLYSNFKCSLLVSVLTLVTFQTGSYLVYARDLAAGHLTVHICTLLVWLVISLGLIHKLTLTIDASFTELKDAEKDNRRLLKNVSEGIIVFSESQDKIEFSNKAAN